MNDERTIRATSGTNLGGASVHNRQVIVDALRVNGPLSRAELARATRLTKQTVSNIIDELERNGLVVSQKSVRNGRGKPATPYVLAPDGACALGLQIDRYVARVVAVNMVGEVLLQIEADLDGKDPREGIKTLLRLIGEARRRLIEGLRDFGNRIAGLGVAMPGPFGMEDDCDEQWAISRWRNFPLLETLAEGSGLKVVLQNDAAAATTAERLVGAAHGVGHAVCIYFGYGLGAGLILNGELFRGINGNAGEIGMALCPGPPGTSPTLEHHASVASLCRMLGLKPSDPDLFAKIEEAVQRADPAMERWLANASKHLRWAVHILESLFDPQTIILCGGAPRILIDRLLDNMLPLLPSLSAHKQRDLPRIQPGLADPWAVALGAAAEPIARAFDPRYSAILNPRAVSGQKD